MEDPTEALNDLVWRAVRGDELRAAIDAERHAEAAYFACRDVTQSAALALIWTERRDEVDRLCDATGKDGNDG